MFKKDRFPDEQDILEKLDRVQDIPNTVRELTEAILDLINTPYEELNRRQKEFVIDTLPDVFTDIVKLNKPSKKINMEIGLFTEAYLKLTSQYNLRKNLIHVIGKIFDRQMREFKLRLIGEVSHEIKEKFFQFRPDFDYLLQPEQRPHCNQIVKDIINQLFSAGVIPKMFEIIKNQTTTPDILAEFITIYSGIESSLVDDVISLMLPTIIDEIIRLLYQQQTDFSGMCTFLAKHFRVNSFYAGQILETLCKMTEGGLYTVRKEVVSEIISIATDPKNQSLVTENAEIIKKTFVDAIDINQNQLILDKIYNFLPKLSEICSFSVEDLESAIEKSNGSCPTSMILNIIPNLQDAHLDKFTSFLITNKYYYPDLFSSLMTRIRTPSARRLLSYMLENKEMLFKVGLEGFKMTANIKTYVSEITPDTPDIIEGLSLFYIKSPKIEKYHDFILATINKVPEAPQLINVLMNLTSTMTRFPCEQVLTDVFCFFFDKFSEEGSKSWVVQLLPVIKAWIAEAPSIPSPIFFEKFKKLNFQTCPNEIPSLFNIVVTKSEDKAGAIDLLMNIISSDVPIRHVHWIITELFSRISDNPDTMAQACSLIMCNLSHSHLRMIFEAAKFEADYFRLEDTDFGLKQKFLIKENENEPEKEFYLSLTSLHSSRRIYAAVSRVMNIPIDELLLWNADPLNEFVIPFGCPLTSLQLSTTDPIILSIEKTKDKILHQKFYDANFLSCLSSRDNINIIIQNIEDYIFLYNVAELIPNFPDLDSTALHILGNNIQRVDKSTLQIFPNALKCYVSNGHVSQEDIAFAAVFVAQHSFDSVSLTTCCDAIVNSGVKINVNLESAELLVLKAEDSRIREMAIKVINVEDPSLIINLVDRSRNLEYRSKSNQLFRFAKQFNIPSTVYEEFYSDLKQFEMNLVWDIDETFIGLLDLIEPKKETIQLTINRLFTQPTCASCMNPFLQTHESRTAAYKFLRNKNALPFIAAFIQKLKQTPTILQAFSDDFTPRGRLGLLNFSTTCYINAVLQNMVAMPNLMAPLLSMPSSGLTPFVMELRNLLGLIRYGRGTPLKITNFTETVPEFFEPNMQQDAHEFFDLVINRLTKEIPNPEVINEQLCGKIRNDILNSKTGEVITTSVESFYYITLAIKGLKNIQEAFQKYFEDSEISSGYRIESGDIVPACRRNRVESWPNYMVLQLERWDYTYANLERSKLTQELQFPVELTPPESSQKYQLSGVVVHEGEAERGHYTAIVRSESGNDWYFCNDHDIVNFDPANLGPWCFGASEPKLGETVWTGYLLFYKKIGLEEVLKPQINPDLEVFIDEYNDTYWPAQCLYSHQFISYAEDLILQKEQTDMTLDIIFRTFFRVAIVNEKILAKWTDLLAKYILNDYNRCKVFFHYIKTLLGNQLPNVLSISDAVAENLEETVKNAISMLNDTTEHIKTLLQGVDYGTHKRAMVFALDIISFCCDSLNVEWSQEESALMSMSLLLTMDMQKEVQRSTGNVYFMAFDKLARVLCDAVKSPAAADVIANFLDVNMLNRIVDSLKMSINFMALLVMVANTRPDLLEHLIDAHPRVQTIVNSAIPIPIGGTSEIAMSSDVTFYFSHSNDTIFHHDIHVRERTLETLKMLVGQPEPHILHFISRRPYDRTIPIPKVTAESSFAHHILDQCDAFLEAISYDAHRGCQYIILLQSVVSLAPMSTRGIFNKLIGPIISDKTGDLLELFMPIIHHLVAFDSSILDTLTPDQREVFRNMAQPTILDVELVLMAPQVFAGSWLLGECVEFVMTMLSETEASVSLINLLTEMKCEVRCPSEAHALWALKPAIKMAEIGCCDRDMLVKFMASALRFAKPVGLCRHMPIVREALDKIKDINSEIVDNYVNNLL